MTLDQVQDIVNGKLDDAFEEIAKMQNEDAYESLPKIVIEYHTENVYGKLLDYVKDEGQARIIRQLTGKLTIDSATRELLRDLTAGAIQWKQL